MSRFMLSLGLLLGSLTGLANAMPPHVSTQLMRARTVAGDIGFASGPFATNEQAEAEKLRLQAAGWKIGGLRQEDDGWWVYYSKD